MQRLPSKRNIPNNMNCFLVQFNNIAFLSHETEKALQHIRNSAKEQGIFDVESEESYNDTSSHPERNHLCVANESIPVLGDIEEESDSFVVYCNDHDLIYYNNCVR